MNGQTFVIVGASLSGAKAVEASGEFGFDGKVVLIGSEAARPTAAVEGRRERIFAVAPQCDPSHAQAPRRGHRPASCGCVVRARPARRHG